MPCEVDEHETHDDADKCHWAVSRGLMAGDALAGICNGWGAPGIYATRQRVREVRRVPP